MKKILYIHHGKGIGGAPKSLLLLIQGLDRTLYHPIILFLYESPAIDLFRAAHIEVFGPLNMSDFSHTAIWWYRWYHPHHFFRAIFDQVRLFFGGAGSLLRQLNPDLIHLNTSSLLAFGLVAHRMNISVVWHIREPLAPGYFGLRRWIVTQIIARCADKILPICKADGKPWHEMSKVRVCYNTARVGRIQRSKEEIRQELGLSLKAPVILYLGGLSYEKGSLSFLKRFKLLKEIMPSVRLVCAGSWDFSPADKLIPTAAVLYARENRKILEDLGRSVVKVGLTKDVSDLFAVATILVFPAIVGHFARPIIEASMEGVPVIAPNIAPFDELVEDGKTGFLVENTDEGWIQSLVLLLNDKQLQTNFGRYGAVFAQKRFGFKRQRAIINDVYRELLF